MTKDIHKRVISASLYTIFGFGLSQIIRLAGNLVLTRLLMPELFGIVAIAGVFQLGLGLFSDIGLTQGIIRSDRAYDPDFLNSAWTLQILRGIILAVLMCLIAYPVSVIYEEPILFKIIPVIGINSIINGFASTSIVLLNKELHQKKIVIMEITIQVISIVIMATVAYYTHSVWSLLIRSFLLECTRTVWSHLINKDRKNRLRFEKKAVTELLSFGKWILFSTGLMFLATQSDRLLLGKFFTMSMFGVYNIALNFAEMPRKVVEKISSNIIYPLISNLLHYTNTEIRDRMRKPRGHLLYALAALVAIFGSFGDFIIDILYDQRYQEARWILPLLAFGMWPMILNATIDRSLVSIGKPKYIAFSNMSKFLYIIVAIPVFSHFFGDYGAIIAVVLNDIPSYIVINIGLKKESLSLIRQDLKATILFIAISGILLSLRLLLGIGVPFLR